VLGPDNIRVTGLFLPENKRGLTPVPECLLRIGEAIGSSCSVVLMDTGFFPENPCEKPEKLPGKRFPSGS
jgi:hypothetical protein